MDEHQKNRKKKKGKVVILAIGGIVVLILAAGVFVVVHNKIGNIFGPATPSSQKDVQTTISEVGKLMLLPTETPTLATVTDITKVQGQPFFKNASDGDRILMYRTAREAILYDPNKNMIINVAPLNIEAPSPTPVVITTSANPQVVLYYNRDSNGYDAKTEQAIGQMNNITVKSRVKAKKNYNKAQVAVLTKADSTEASSLAQSLNAAIGTFPSGESTPPSGTDIVIIVGK